MGIPGLTGLAITTIQDTLDKLAQTLYIAPEVPAQTLVPLQAGQALGAKVVPHPPTLNFTDIVQGLQDPSTVSLPLPLGIKVDLDVHWEVSVSRPHPPHKPRTTPAQTPALVGDDYLIQQGGGAPEASLLFAPDVFSEYAGIGSGLPAPTTFLVSATVTLIARVVRDSDTMQEITSGPHDLDGLKVPVLPLMVPTVLAAFEHPLYNGFALICVPSTSPVYAPSSLVGTLNRLHSTVSSLRSFASFGSFLLGLEQFTSALPEDRPLIFLKRNEVGHLNRITVKKHEFVGIDWLVKDSTADEKISSMIFMGSKGRRVQCFLGKGCTGKNITLTTGQESCVVIPNLDVNQMTSYPGNPGELTANPQSQALKTFNDEISSIRFVSP